MTTVESYLKSIMQTAHQDIRYAGYGLPFIPKPIANYLGAVARDNIIAAASNFGIENVDDNYLKGRFTLITEIEERPGYMLRVEADLNVTNPNCYIPYDHYIPEVLSPTLNVFRNDHIRVSVVKKVPALTDAEFLERKDEIVSLIRNLLDRGITMWDPKPENFGIIDSQLVIIDRNAVITSQSISPKLEESSA